jgi:hypothetical protein
VSLSWPGQSSRGVAPDTLKKRVLRSNAGLQSAESSHLMTTQRRMKRQAVNPSVTESLGKRDASESTGKSREVKLDRRKVRLQPL